MISGVDNGIEGGIVRKSFGESSKQTYIDDIVKCFGLEDPRPNLNTHGTRDRLHARRTTRVTRETDSAGTLPLSRDDRSPGCSTALASPGLTVKR